MALRPEIKCLGDQGDQGIKKYHNNSFTPKKKPRKSNLTIEDKRKNRELARLRIVCEQINRKLKIFRILSEKYRNRRKRFGLRFNLIAPNIQLRTDGSDRSSKLTIAAKSNDQKWGEKFLKVWEKVNFIWVNDVPYIADTQGRILGRNSDGNEYIMYRFPD